MQREMMHRVVWRNGNHSTRTTDCTTYEYVRGSDHGCVLPFAEYVRCVRLDGTDEFVLASRVKTITTIEREQ